jgi:hypothetical protein
MKPLGCLEIGFIYCYSRSTLTIAQDIKIPDIDQPKSGRFMKVVTVERSPKRTIRISD